MRVIHVAPIPFGPSGMLGGGERYPIELARALAQHIETELISFGRFPERRREPGGLWIRTIRPLTTLHHHPAHSFAPSLITALAHADIVHTHHMRSTPSRLAAMAARARRRGAVVTDHGLQGGNWGGLLQRLFQRFLTVSAYSALELQAPPERTQVIYGGADPRRFYPDETIRRNGVLFVGRLTPHKGVDRLLAALPQGARLRIAGSSGHDRKPPERDYPLLLRRLAAGREVEFLGAVPDSLLPDLYRHASVLVLPSVERTCYGRSIRVSELLGLVVLEAMASGTPVICSRLGGLPEVVQDGITGFLVEPGNIEELRERIAELVGNPALASRLGNNARDLALDRFTWQACAERCLSVYEGLRAEGY
ncbi:MAG: glycosyltransferase family 4 protein [Dehalococcoidia bacterium]